jgi:hypothetical protein
MLACDVCALDHSTRHWVTRSVVRLPVFDYEDHWCHTACFYHRNVLDMSPPDGWKPPRAARTDNFMMDLENNMLADFEGHVPTGKNRHTNPQWAELVRRHVDPYHSDVTWCEYVEWVSDGGGDEWFQDPPSPVSPES